MRSVRRRDDNQPDRADSEQLVETAHDCGPRIGLRRFVAMALHDGSQAKSFYRRDHGSMKRAPGKSETNQSDINHVSSTTSRRIALQCTGA